MTGGPGLPEEQQGYMGLQTDSARPETSRGEGVGMSCRAAATIDVSSTYTSRVKKLEADATGQWWGGWIDNATTGSTTYLGDLHNSSPWIDTERMVNFSEYWGSSVSTETAQPPRL